MSQIAEPINPLSIRIELALEFAMHYGGIDGDHHKAWVIDQMVRALLGSDESYTAWVKEVNGEGDYRWETGIAP